MNYAEGIFSIPFFHMNVKNWKEKKDKILKLKNSNSLIENENIITDYFSPFSDNSKDYSAKITKILKTEISSIKSFFKIQNHFVSGSWIEVAQKNMCHYVHTHGPMGISAVCYLEYDEKEHSPTIFKSPNLNYITGMNDEFTPPNIREGSIIAFPSNIDHFTKVNYSDIQRVILSFNLSSKLEPYAAPDEFLKMLPSKTTSQ